MQFHEERKRKIKAYAGELARRHGLPEPRLFESQHSNPEFREVQDLESFNKFLGDLNRAMLDDLEVRSLGQSLGQLMQH